MVDVAADHAMHAALVGLARHGMLEVAHIAHGALHFALEVFRQRPVGQPHARAQAVEVPVELERELVERVTHVGQPLGALDHAVEQIAVHHPQLAAVGRLVDPLLGHVDAAEVVVQVLARELIVVAGDEDHARALARLAQQLLDHVVVRLRPVPVPLELPAVDDVADQEQRVALGVLEEVQQRPRLAAGRAQVQVGDPQRAVALRRAAGLVVIRHQGPGRGVAPCAQESVVALHGLAASRPRVTGACPCGDRRMTRRGRHAGLGAPNRSAGLPPCCGGSPRALRRWRAPGRP